MSAVHDRIARWALAVCSDRQIEAELRRRQRRQRRLEAMRRHPSAQPYDEQHPWTRRVWR